MFAVVAKLVPAYVFTGVTCRELVFVWQSGRAVGCGLAGRGGSS